jgi:hypothetical protein
MGDGSKIPRFFSQYVKDTATINLGKTLENKLCFYFIIYSSFVIWTSYPKGAHCLSD